jgi:hypothetical protein
LVVKKSSTYNRRVSRFEDSSTLKQQIKMSSSTSRRNYSDDDASPGGFGVEDDYTEPPPPGHTPEFNRDVPRPPIKPSLMNHTPDSISINSSARDQNRSRRRSRSPPISPFYRAPTIRPQLTAIDSNRISPVEFRRESWRESWRQPDNRPRMTPEPEPFM